MYHALEVHYNQQLQEFISYSHLKASLAACNAAFGPEYAPVHGPVV